MISGIGRGYRLEIHYGSRPLIHRVAFARCLVECRLRAAAGLGTDDVVARSPRAPSVAKKRTDINFLFSEKVVCELVARRWRGVGGGGEAGGRRWKEVGGGLGMEGG